MVPDTFYLTPFTPLPPPPIEKPGNRGTRLPDVLWVVVLGVQVLLVGVQVIRKGGASITIAWRIR
jgi:hypothetical protein